MMRWTLIPGLALLLVGAAASAQVASITVGPGSSIKTPPLADSDSFVLGIETHIPAANPPFLGWSGVILSVHILDNSEADVVATHSAFFRNPLGPPNGPVLSPSVVNSSPFGPPSNNIQSIPVSFNLYTQAPSGLNVFTSQRIRVASALLHAKNTTALNNSDIDATFQIWNIYHVRASSTTFPVPGSVRLWVTSGGLNPGGTLGNPSAHWTHVTDTIPLHAFQSAFIATFVGAAALGIEHVPEPASAALLGLGLVSLAGSRLARRRRMSA